MAATDEAGELVLTVAAWAPPERRADPRRQNFSAITGMTEKIRPGGDISPPEPPRRRTGWRRFPGGAEGFQGCRGVSGSARTRSRRPGPRCPACPGAQPPGADRCSARPAYGRSYVVLAARPTAMSTCACCDRRPIVHVPQHLRIGRGHPASGRPTTAQVLPCTSARASGKPRRRSTPRSRSRGVEADDPHPLDALTHPHDDDGVAVGHQLPARGHRRDRKRSGRPVRRRPVPVESRPSNPTRIATTPNSISPTYHQHLDPTSRPSRQPRSTTPSIEGGASG